MNVERGKVTTVKKNISGDNVKAFIWDDGTMRPIDNTDNLALTYTVLAIEQVEGAVMLDKLDVDPTKKYAIVFGNEVMGVDQAVVDICDGAIEVPQVGTKHSINVSVCGGVVLWKFFERFINR